MSHLEATADELKPHVLILSFTKGVRKKNFSRKILKMEELGIF